MAMSPHTCLRQWRLAMSQASDRIFKRQAQVLNTLANESRLLVVGVVFGIGVAGVLPTSPPIRYARTEGRAARETALHASAGSP